MNQEKTRPRVAAYQFLFFLYINQVTVQCGTNVKSEDYEFPVTRRLLAILWVGRKRTYGSST